MLLRMEGDILTDGVPKYIAVRDNLRARIEVMETNEQLPPEIELCRQYNVSRITLRHAVDNLITEGLLIREQGRGTFRASTLIRSNHQELISDRAQGFYEQSYSNDAQIRVKVLENDVVQDEDAAKHLGLEPDDELICLKRLRYVDGVLSRYSVLYLSASRFPKVLTQDFSKESLAEFLMRSYAVDLVESEVSVYVERLCGRIASLLNLEEETPAIAARSTVKDKFGTIIAFGAAVYTPSSGEIHFHLHSSNMQ